MEKKLVIAIDGPAGAGKSTVAQIVAQRLGYTYIDTGAMYRAVAWQAMQDGRPPERIAAEVAAASNIELRYTDGKTIVHINGQDITEEIRTPLVSNTVSMVARIPAVRMQLVEQQRRMARAGGVVLDGRDIGTYVLPAADVKIFLTASIEERARRRWLELTAKGYSVVLEDLQAEIACRDKNDCEREVAPLVQAQDAVLVDTTMLSIHGAAEAILTLCRQGARHV